MIDRQEIESILRELQQLGTRLTNSLSKGSVTTEQLGAHGVARQAIAEAVAKLELLKGTLK